MPVESAVSIIHIQQTLNLYPLSVDNKNYALFARIFTHNVTANLLCLLPTTSLPAMRSQISKSLAGLVSQHALTTQSISVLNATEAKALTYLTATFFGQGNQTGHVLTIYGEYTDTLVYGKRSGWLISDRKLVYKV